MRKRHTRPSQADPDGGIISFEASDHVSNVMLVDTGFTDHGESGSHAGGRRRHKGADFAVKSGQSDSPASVASDPN